LKKPLAEGSEEKNKLDFQHDSTCFCLFYSHPDRIKFDIFWLSVLPRQLRMSLLAAAVALFRGYNCINAAQTNLVFALGIG
jgi:hypothetical protein